MTWKKEHTTWTRDWSLLYRKPSCANFLLIYAWLRDCRCNHFEIEIALQKVDSKRLLQTRWSWCHFIWKIIFYPIKNKQWHCLNDIVEIADLGCYVLIAWVTLYIFNYIHFYDHVTKIANSALYFFTLSNIYIFNANGFET